MIAIVMRKDVSFLLDGLEDDDPAVRVAAKSCLETAVGHPVAFDTTLARRAHRGGRSGPEIAPSLPRAKDSQPV